MPRTRSTTALALLVAGVAALSGCSSTVAVKAAPNADDPRCAQVMVLLPDVLGDQSRRWTDAQSTAAWGDPTTVQFTCGTQPTGPTTLPCFTVDGVDWVVDDSRAPLYRIATYGRTPAAELIVDYDAVSSSGPVSALSRLITKRFEVTGKCVAPTEGQP
ncbi:DUF3515 family protein [Microbacterium aquilitoris]|uniref:DUF3515 family protein n=1 Tax=Microbacterium aquilitoris TaxID=3067307 RepID=A0ABU3GKF7_9MICO|nr:MULTISPECIES: DUF3515 family protein [unclassified Microbacterium]MDT3331146.1 DUF3515 family protein [Microbacterium sp. KSW-18]MDT3344079.1 DUF3515 family protein [Microbacterium sp. KSW2-22]